MTTIEKLQESSHVAESVTSVPARTASADQQFRAVTSDSKGARERHYCARVWLANLVETIELQVQALMYSVAWLG